MQRWTALVLAALLALLLVCAPTHAFLSGLLGAQAAASDDTTDDSWQHSDAPASGVAALPAGAANRFLVSETSSMSELHADYRELMRSTGSIPACRGANNHMELASLCNHLTRESKKRIAAAFTECHLATDTYRNVQSCHDASNIEICIKEMNRDPSIFLIYTSFVQRATQICEEVQHDFKLKRTHEAFDSALAATSDMAQALKQWQQDAYASAADLKRDVHSKSSELLSELLRHSDAEAARYESLTAQTSKIESDQKSILTQMTEQAQGVRRLLGDAETIQKLIHATSNDIERTQHEIVTLQRDASAVAGQTHADLVVLKQSQAAEFEKARSSLTALQELQHDMAIAQQRGTAAVEVLTKDQERAFAAAASNLASLASEQAASFRKGQEALGALASQQVQIAAEQSNILGAVKSSGDELRRLSNEQADSFALAGRTLASIRSQAEDAERRLGAVLGELKHVAAQILSVNLDMVSELFRIESAMFYVAFAPLVYMLTATERTQAARFWIFALLLCTLIIELSLVSTAQRFHYTLSSAQFDALRANIRYALSCLSCLSLLLSVLTHKDYGQLAYAATRESRVHLDNNHRMLHELLRRTESLSPPPKSAAFQPNAFQSRAPPRDNEFDDDAVPQIEGVRRALTPRKAERLSMDSTAATGASSFDGSWVDWRQIDPHTCGCPGHAPPKPSLFSFISPKHARSHSTASTTTTGGHARTGSSMSTAAPAAAAAAASPQPPSTTTSAASRHVRTASTTVAAAPAASPEPGTHSEGEEEEEETHEEGAQKQSQSAAAAAAAAGARMRSPRASSRSRSPSPSASPPAAAAAAAYAAPSRITRSASRSQSVSHSNMRAAAARLSTTPLRKSAGPKFLGGAAQDDDDEDEQQPGEETPSKAKGSIKKGAAARRKS